MRLFEQGNARLQIAHTHLARSALCRARGDQAEADWHVEQARAQFERSCLLT
ncbi:MAG: hypothetical protein WCF84_06745 [Anaerolineae bacterium]